MNNTTNVIDLESSTAKVINWLFSELKGNFPGFKQAWPSESEYNSAKKAWLKAFVLAGINKVEQLQHGLNYCYLMENPFIPSPGQFISWCKPSPESLGLLNADQAYPISILINAKFSDYEHEDDRVDTIIRHAINQIGITTYREMPQDNSKKAFKTYYDIALQQFINGELKVIPKVIPEKPQEHPSDKKRSDEARLKAMEELRRMGINVKSVNQGTMSENNLQSRCEVRG